MKRYFVSFWSYILIVFLSAYSPAFGQDIKTPSGTAPVKSLSSISPVEMDSFVYVLKEASISGTQLKIVLEATNKSSRRVIEFINEPGSTVIVDEFRNIYGNPGGTRVYMSCDGSDTSDPYRSKRKKSRNKKLRTHCYGAVDTGETFKLVATFEDFNSGAGKLKSFDTRAQINGSKIYDIGFKNIPLKKEN